MSKTIELTMREAELCLAGLSAWRSDYEGTSHYDYNAREAEALFSKLSSIAAGKQRQWEINAIKQRLAELEAEQ